MSAFPFQFLLNLTDKVTYLPLFTETGHLPRAKAAHNSLETIIKF